MHFNLPKRGVVTHTDEVVTTPVTEQVNSNFGLRSIWDF